MIEPIPDITPLLAPTILGDYATFTFFSIAGLFLGGETGLLTGATSAQRTITSDPERKKRVSRAFREFRADLLRREAEDLEKEGAGVWRDGGDGGEGWLGL
jgi:hypothetical protein